MTPAEAAAHEALYRDFVFGGLPYIDAIERLQKLGYSAIDAEQIVSEWADALEHSRMRSPDNGPHADKTGIVSATGCGVEE